MYRIQIFAFCKLDSYNGDYDTKERKENVMKMKRYLCFSLAGLMLLSSGCGSKGKESKADQAGIEKEVTETKASEEAEAETETETQEAEPDMLPAGFQFEIEPDKGFENYEVHSLYDPEPNSDHSVDLFSYSHMYVTYERFSNYNAVDTSSGIIISSNDPDFEPYTIDIGNTVEDMNLDLPKELGLKSTRTWVSDSNPTGEVKITDEDFKVDTVEYAPVLSVKAIRSMLYNDSDISDAFPGVTQETLPQFVATEELSNVKLDWNENNEINEITVGHIANQGLINHNVQTFVNVYGLEFDYKTTLGDCLKTWGVPYYRENYTFWWKTDKETFIKIEFDASSELQATKLSNNYGPMLYVATTDIPDFVHYLDLWLADRQDPIELDLSPIYESTEETTETTEQTE